jgi:hypothetical protein
MKLSNPAVMVIMRIKEKVQESARGKRCRSKKRLSGVNSTAKKPPRARGIKIDFPTTSKKTKIISNANTASALR